MNNSIPVKPLRIKSIDVLRALTVVLMIFVNDIPGVKNIPDWLNHYPAGVDGMGLADVVFPLFLFLVGMSIPFAISNRLAKGESKLSIVAHIVKRSAALVLIGVLMVNTSGLNAEATGLDKNLWSLLMYLAVIAIWSVYPKKENGKAGILGRWLPLAAWVVLIVLAVIYRGGENDQIRWLTPQWWGILGLIGWAYLFSALAFLIIGSKIRVTAVVLILLMAYHMLMESILPVKGWVNWLVLPGGGSYASMTTIGLLASLILRRYSENLKTFFSAFFLLGVLFFILGFATRPYWGISKLGDTPSWVYICMGISFWSFALVYYIVDIKGKASWFRFFEPAGVNTFLAYLLPSVYYHAIWFAGLYYPLWLSHSWGGLFRGILFSLLMVQITAWLTRRNVRLKL